MHRPTLQKFRLIYPPAEPLVPCGTWGELELPPLAKGNDLGGAQDHQGRVHGLGGVCPNMWGHPLQNGRLVCTSAGPLVAERCLSTHSAEWVDKCLSTHSAEWVFFDNL